MNFKLVTSPFFGVLLSALTAGLIALASPSDLRAQDATAQDLLDRLPNSTALEVEGDQLFIKAPSGTRYRIVGLTEQAQFPLIETPAGRVALDGRDLEAGALGVLDKVEFLVSRAQELKAPLEGAVLGTSLVAGPRLWAGDWLILEEVAMKRTALPRRTDSLDRLKESIAALQASVDGWQEELARKSLEHLLERVTRAEESDDDDHVTPGLARRVIENGWLRSFFGESAEVKAVEDAVAAAVTPKAQVRFEAEGWEYAVLSDAFGEQRWVMRTPKKLVWAAIAPEPDYGGDKVPEVRVVVKAPRDAEVANAPIAAVTAYVGHEAIASWSSSEGFSVDETIWRRHFPASSPRRTRAVTGFLPPHIVVPSWAGGVRLLLTQHGVVDPPKVNATEAFLAQAAKSLPDAAHLDLVGEYLFSYVKDSPDSRYPTLIGFEDAMGEIHQSVEQTLATSAGGICRGDCDDIAELYQSLANRQGRLAHIMNVPRHNALAFAEKKEDDWHVFVLHTGPPLEFRGSELPQVLTEAYRHFGTFESVDPDALPVAIRFSGENTRSQWALGWRIFRDPDYAETMIDVQRDWHFHTYRRGIEKMEALVALGDDDPANYLELSGLSERTNQHAKAVKYLRRAMALGEDPALQTRMRLLGDLYELEDEEALQAELGIIDAKLKRLMRERNPAILTVSQTIAAIAANVGKDAATARKVLGEYQVRFAGVQANMLRRALRDDPKQAAEDPALSELLGFIRQFVSIASETIRLERDAAFADPNLKVGMAICEDWISSIAYKDPDVQRDLGIIDSVAADYYEAVLGRPAFEALLEATPDRAKGEIPGPSGGVATLSELLPRLKRSPYYWAGRYMELFDREHKTLDRKAMQRLYDRAMATFDQGEVSPQARDARADLRRGLEFSMALVEGDDEKIREYFAWVRDEDDKRTRDGVASTLGGTARFMSVESWRKTLVAFDEIIAYKPGYFYLAWEAVDGDAPRHALIAAEFATRRFPEDKAFFEEAVFMKELLKK